MGRYSFLAADPFLQLEARGHEVTVVADAGTRASSTATIRWKSSRHRVEAIRSATLPELPPFTSRRGRLCRLRRGALQRAPAQRAGQRSPLPDLAFAFYDHMVVFDHVNKTNVVVAMARLDKFGDDLQAAYADAQRRVDELVEQLEAAGRRRCRRPTSRRGGSADDRLPLELHAGRLRSAPSRSASSTSARAISFRSSSASGWNWTSAAQPFEIYRTLRVVNPSPFMFYLRTPSVTLVGSSPEIMVRVVDGRVTVRPLAGTRRRGATEEEDRRLAEELLADPKERAEHVMLVDLGRNDVGRVARYRSVELTDVMTIERYSHVMHITSNVSGQLAEGRDAFDALRACLPAGTVSGAPKVRAMEIIDEIEPHRRGPYAGAVGYVDFNGNMDTCIALRTLVVQGDKAYVQAGAGIVADSDAGRRISGNAQQSPRAAQGHRDHRSAAGQHAPCPVEASLWPSRGPSRSSRHGERLLLDMRRRGANASPPLRE